MNRLVDGWGSQVIGKGWKVGGYLVDRWRMACLWSWTEVHGLGGWECGWRGGTEVHCDRCGISELVFVVLLFAPL